MSGQCYGCGASYSVFKKEYSCRNCRFSFCNKCANKKIAIPHLQNEKHLVCTRCYDILTKRIPSSESESQPPPPDTYYKRIADLKQEKKPTSSKPAVQVNTKYANLPKPDQEIAARLDRLQVDDKSKKPIPTFSELDNRLKKLKDTEAGPSSAPGASSVAAHTSDTYRPPDRRTQSEQTDDLLAQMRNEVTLDQQNQNRTDDLTNRLKSLNTTSTDTKIEGNNLNKADDGAHKSFHKNIDEHTGVESDGSVDINRVIAEMASELEMDAKAAIQSLQEDRKLREKLDEIKKKQRKQNEKTVGDCETSSDNESDEEDVNTLIKRLLEESKLDDAMDEDGINIPTSSDNEEKQVSDPDELPWCCMCNENADVRCVECDMDLYCHKCFKKCHKQSAEMKHHKASKYVRPKSLQNL